jgi:hypothetical protein
MTILGGLTVFKAVEKQLWLKIEERKHPQTEIAVGRAGKSKGTIPQ